MFAYSELNGERITIERREKDGKRLMRLFVI